VWDVAVEGMSLVSSYRAQFNQIIRASSYQDLVQRLARVGAPKTVGPGS
jgi:phospholipid transport system substrate-binding protein